MSDEQLNLASDQKKLLKMFREYYKNHFQQSCTYTDQTLLDTFSKAASDDKISRLPTINIIHGIADRIHNERKAAKAFGN
jgi:hypothetical protein